MLSAFDPFITLSKKKPKSHPGGNRTPRLFERSEFLIDTWYTPPKKSVRVCVCVCSTNLGFSVTSANGIRPNHGIHLPAYIHIVLENTHTHIATAASETEGVTAVSWIE